MARVDPDRPDNTDRPVVERPSRTEVGASAHSPYDSHEDDDGEVIVVGQDRKPTLPAGIWILLTCALATIAAVGLRELQSIIGPAFLSLTLVLTIRPLHRWMVRHRVPMWISAIVTMVLLLGLFLGFIGIMIVAFIPLPSVLEGYQDKFREYTNNVIEFAAEQGLDTTTINEMFSNIDYSTIVSTAWSAFNQITSITGVLVVIILAIFFIVIDTLRMDARSSIVQRAAPEFHEALSGFEGRVRQYWLVSTIFGLIVAVFDWIALEIMGIPLALAWAVVSFLTNYIPNVGFVLGLIPPALLGLLEGGWQLMLWVIVAYSLINFIIQSLLQPKFTADAVGLSASVTFLSLMAWGTIIGALGAILAVPLTLFFKAILIDSSRQTRWIDAFLTSESDARRKQESGQYDVSYESPDPWGGLQTAVVRVARGIRKPLWTHREDESQETKPRRRRGLRGRRAAAKHNGSTRAIRAPRSAASPADSATTASSPASPEAQPPNA